MYIYANIYTHTGTISMTSHLFSVVATKNRGRWSTPSVTGLEVPVSQRHEFSVFVNL